MWSDKQLAAHKKAQGYSSAAGATLGISALGAASLKSGVARKAAVKLTRLTGKDVKGARKKIASRATGLSIGAAGIGGVGGYNFAAIQSQEAKRAKLGKSVWGIDHGQCLDTTVTMET